MEKFPSDEIREIVVISPEALEQLRDFAAKAEVYERMKRAAAAAAESLVEVVKALQEVAEAVAEVVFVNMDTLMEIFDKIREACDDLDALEDRKVERDE